VILKNIFSTGIFNIASQVIIFLAEIIIARILSPEDFGVFAISLLVVELVQILSLKNFAVAYVQNNKADEIDLFSVVLVTFLLSGSITALTILFLPDLSRLWGGEALVTGYTVLAWVTPVMLLEYIYRMALMKKGAFWQVAAAELSSVIVYAAVAWWLSKSGYGFYSLLYAFMVRQLVKMVTIIILAKKKYKLITEFKWSSVLRLFRMTSGMTVQNLFIYATSNTDRYFANLAGGVTAVGLYSRALKLIKVPLDQIVRNVSSVLYVEFSNKQDNQHYLINTFLTASGILALLFIPACSILIIYSENIISIIYGEKWLAMVPLFQMLILGAIVSAMSVIVGDLIKSQGVIYKEIASNITALIVLISFSIWLYPIYGVLGVAISYVLGQTTLLLCQVYILSKLININYFYYFKIYLFPLLLSVIFVFVSSCINRFVDTTVGLLLCASITVLITLLVLVNLKNRREKTVNIFMTLMLLK